MTLTNNNPRYDLWALAAKIVLVLAWLFYFCSCSRNVTKSIQKTDSTIVHQVAKVLDSSKAAVQVKKRNNTTHFTKRTTTVTTPILIEVDSVSQVSDHTAQDYLPYVAHRSGKTYVIANQTKKVEVYTGGTHSVTTDSSTHSNNFHQAETSKDSTHVVSKVVAKNVKTGPSVWWWLLLIPIGYLVRRYWPKIKAILFA